MKYLIVVDMQNDFITGSLGSELATAIVPYVVQKVKGFDGKVIFTRDTHQGLYLQTQEGQKLPVKHCAVRSLQGYLRDLKCNALKGSFSGGKDQSGCSRLRWRQCGKS